MSFRSWLVMKEKVLDVGFTGFQGELPQNTGEFQKVRSKYVQQDPEVMKQEKKLKMKKDPANMYGFASRNTR